MAKDPVDSIVSTIRSACNRVERIILFGSRARGDNRARSDIDIAVACPRANQREWLDICDAVDDADTLLPVDMVRLDTAGEPIKARILREGRVLYERKSDESHARSLGKALDRLEEALGQPLENPLAVDATIQRFEFTIELFWKALKRCLDFEGIDTSTPRGALQQAYQVGWLEDESKWLQIRNPAPRLDAR
jgi:predicted nucleotidyltransferase